jgi:hypothetical protein
MRDAIKLTVAWHLMKIYEARFGLHAKHIHPVQRKVKIFSDTCCIIQLMHFVILKNIFTLTFKNTKMLKTCL